MKQEQKKGHNYMTSMIDMLQSKVLSLTKGKDHTTIERLVNDFEKHHGIKENIVYVSADLSCAFRKGITEILP